MHLDVWHIGYLRRLNAYVMRLDAHMCEEVEGEGLTRLSIRPKVTLKSTDGVLGSIMNNYYIINKSTMLAILTKA